jgi:glycosyltransferase involved in cell wall biosynthesis
LRLLYLGRFDALKGGRLALEGLPELVRRLRRPVVLTLAGEGPERGVWERAAARAQAAEPGVTVEFPGWVGGVDRLRVLAEADVLLVPSVWPEPFGMTGIEAGFFGVPAVAFDVGGVRAWLEPGVNGELAAGDPPTVRGLVEAVVRVAGDAGHYRRLAEAALERAGRFTMDRHLDALEPFLGEAMDRRRVVGGLPRAGGTG